MNCRIINAGNRQILKFDCRKCENTPSIARTERCLREILKGLSKHPIAEEILLDGDYIQEYSGKSVTSLRNFIRSIDDSRYLVLKTLNVSECDKCRENRGKKIDEIWERLVGDPLRGYAELKQWKAELEEKSQRGRNRCRRCRKIFFEEGVEPALATLKRTPFIKGVNFNERRLGYEKILAPTIRPCFLRSKLKLQPPSGAELVDTYEVESQEVRIYRLPQKLQHLYFIFPAEFRLSPREVQLLQEARRRLLDRKGNLNLKLAKEEIKRRGRNLVMDVAIESGFDLSMEKIENLSKFLTRFTVGLGILKILLIDSQVQDVYADAPIDENPLHIYHQKFEECLTNVYLTPEDAEFLASRFRSISGRPFSEANPILDLDLEGVRIAAIQKPLSPNGLALALRRHKATPWTLPQFVENGFLTPEAAGLLSLLVDAQSSVLIGGNRGAGKTSLLGALLLELLPKYRILILEDTAELPTDQLRSLGYKVQSLRLQQTIAVSQFELKAEDALRAALRLGESVLVVGEVRGTEARTLYEVGAAGNSVMGTIHGATTMDVFDRVVYDLGIPASSFKATNVIVVASPIRPRGSVSRVRRITQISEVKTGWRDDPRQGGFADLMSYHPSKDKLKPTPCLRKGQSELLKSIARKWSVDPPEIMKNLELRAKIQKKLVEKAGKTNRSDLIEAEKVVKSNLTFHQLLEDELRNGGVDYDRIFEKWFDWLEGETDEV